MEKQIIGKLKFIEELHNIKILFAVENGSRAWGMASKDSDYDVRFVFVRNIDNYLSINKQKDVIEWMSNDKMIDIVGFDIYKFVSLLKKSNPTMIEWLTSPIVYTGNVPPGLKWLGVHEFNPKALYYHYKSLCKNNYMKYIASGNNVTYKRYMYCLRGLFNAKYTWENYKVPSNDFKTVFNQMGQNSFVNHKIRDMLKAKEKGEEKDEVERITLLDQYIEEFLADEKEIDTRQMDINALDIEIKNIVYYYNKN